MSHETFPLVIRFARTVAKRWTAHHIRKLRITAHHISHKAVAGEDGAATAYEKRRPDLFKQLPRKRNEERNKLSASFQTNTGMYAPSIAS